MVNVIMFYNYIYLKNNINRMRNKISNLTRKSKIAIALLTDIFSAFFSWLIFGPPGTIFLAERFSRNIASIAFDNYLNFIIPTILSIGFMTFFGFYSQIIRFYDSSSRLWVPLLGCLIFGLSWILIYIQKFDFLVSGFLYIVILQGVILSTVFFSLISAFRDIAKNLLKTKSNSPNPKKTVIYGAGSSGIELYQSLSLDRNIDVIAFFDDSKEFKGTKINQIDIIVDFDELEKKLNKFEDVQILLSIPSISLEKRRQIISKLEKLKVDVRSIPSLHEIVADRKKMTDIQPLSIDDILPRKRVESFNRDILKGKNVLITGAGGSIGSEISRQTFSMDAKKVVLFDISEFNLFTIHKELIDLKTQLNSKKEIYPVLGDIKESDRFKSILKRYEIDIVYHAAAYKHVPLVEFSENILYSIQNNIFGTYSVIKSCLNSDVSSAILVSTDKAVRPTNIMGATKRFAEQIVQSLQAENKDIRLSMVRFGNVINSSGSVIPLFRKQISDGGPLTVTHKDVTRYFMTIPEASSLVIQAERFASGGEVFLLDMGEQVRIYDLAKKLIHLSGNSIAKEKDSKGIYIQEIGLRPGEKLFEELLISGDESQTENPKIFKSIESFPSIDKIEKEITKLNECIACDDINGAILILKNNVEGFKHEPL